MTRVVWDWQDSPPTYLVRRGDEVICVTNRFKSGYEQAKAIAEAMNTPPSSAEDQFVLDLASNPHPRMLRRALAHRRQAYAIDANPQVVGYWKGYLAAMSDATGCTELDLLRWLDRHEADQ